MNIFNNILTWIIDHKDPIIIGIVVELVVVGSLKTSWFITKNIPKALKRLKNIKAIKYLGFIFLYAFPLGTIIWMIVDSTNEPTFKNIALFILICLSLVYNILMSHIINLYKMNTRLTKISSDKLTEIDNTFDKVYSHIEKTKSDNKLK